jgi:hypothetical protein
MTKRLSWIIASILLVSAWPAVSQEVGDTIKFEHGGETVSGVVTSVDRGGEAFIVDVTDGPRKGKKQRVRASQIIGADGNRTGGGDEPEKLEVNDLKVGRKVTFQRSGETVTGVIVDVIREGRLYRVEMTSGSFKGHKIPVSADDLLEGPAKDGGDKPDADDKPKEDISGKYKVGDVIRFEHFGDEVIGVVTELRNSGRIYGVEIKTGERKGRTTTAWLDDILGLAEGGIPEEKPDPRAEAIAALKIGDKIRYHSPGNEPMEGVITAINSSFLTVDITAGERKGKWDHVSRDRIILEGLENIGPDGSNEPLEEPVNLRVGDRIRYKDFFGKNQDAIIIESKFGSKSVKVHVTAGDRKGREESVNLKDVLGKLPDKAREHGNEKGGDFKIGDQITFKKFPDGNQEGVIIGMSGKGDRYEVEITEFFDRGKTTSISKDDIFFKNGHIDVDPAQIIQGVKLSDELIKLRIPAVSDSYRKPDLQPFWNVPAIGADAPGLVRAQTIDLKISSSNATIKSCGPNVLVYSGSSGLQFVNLANGKASEPIQGVLPSLVSPSGDRVLMALPSQGRLEYFKRRGHLFEINADHQLEHVAQLAMQDEGSYIALPSNEQVLLSGRNGLSINPLAGGKATATFPRFGMSHWGDRGNLLIMNDLRMIDSPGGDGSLVQGTVFTVLEPTTGKVLGHRPLPMMIFQFTLSPDGKRLTFRSDPDGLQKGGGDIVTVDMTTGRELGRLSLSQASTQLSYIDDRFVSVEGKGMMMVLDTKTHLLVWQYQQGTGVSSLSVVHGALMAVTAAPKLVVKAIDTQAITAAANKADPAKMLSVGRGASMALHIKTTADRKEIESKLIARLFDAGISVDPNAKLQLHVTTQRSSIKRKYREGTKETTVNVDAITLELKLTEGGNELWTATQKQAPPMMVSVRQGETLNQAIDRITGEEAEKRMFDRMPLPTRVMSDDALQQIQSTTIQ